MKIWAVSIGLWQTSNLLPEVLWPVVLERSVNFLSYWRGSPEGWNKGFAECVEVFFYSGRGSRCCALCGISSRHGAFGGAGWCFPWKGGWFVATFTGLESKLARKLNVMKARLPELKTCLDSSAAHVSFLIGERKIMERCAVLLCRKENSLKVKVLSSYHAAEWCHGPEVKFGRRSHVRVSHVYTGTVG